MLFGTGAEASGWRYDRAGVRSVELWHLKAFRSIVTEREGKETARTAH